MSKRVSSLIRGLVLILMNLVIIITLFIGFEIYLRLTDKFTRLPFDTGYYKGHKQYYPELKMSKKILEDDLTWGYPVYNNAFGFREEEIDHPKPADVCRIMVLGDSFTWGVGLDIDDRYPNIVEHRLKETFPHRKIEVISWARRNWSTATQRDALGDFKDWLTPDYIVVGYVLNDPQPKNHDYTLEKEQFDRQYQGLLNNISTGLIRVGLPRTAQTMRLAFDNFLVKSRLLPSWEVGMQRTYEPDSTEWLAFTDALQDIKTMSDEMGLPAPLFIVLNQGNFWHQPIEVTNLDPSLPIYLRWYHQAELAAAKIGFRTYNHEKELLEQVSQAEIQVNELDYHPSAQVNQVYADKLFQAVAAEIKQDRLCRQEAGRGAITATAAPLADKRLLSVRFGPELRFLGYTTDSLSLAEEGALELSLGWQVLEEVDTNYTVVLELLDTQGKLWQQQESVPCQGQCPTVFWPVGLIAPPGSEIIYWPEKSKILPFSLEELPYQGELRDIHKLTLDPQLPPGEYLLRMGLYQPNLAVFLPALDEISYTGYSENRVILGKVTLPD